MGKARFILFRGVFAGQRLPMFMIMTFSAVFLFPVIAGSPD